jgi:hypothetical protein
MDREKLDEILRKHLLWLDGEKGGERADLGGADLGGAYIDFAAWPLWCGSMGVKVDLGIVYQLLAHVACLDCDKPEFAEIQAAILPYATKSHRAEDLGLLDDRPGGGE